MQSIEFDMETEELKDRHILPILWRIENIKLLQLKQSWFGTSSTVFTVRTLEEKKFKLYLWPKGWVGASEHLKLRINPFDDPINFPIDCEWSFIGSNGSSLVNGTLRNHTLGRNQPLNITSGPTHEEVFVTRKSVFLPHNTLTVRFRIWSSNGNLSNDEFVSCVTRCETTNYSFLWPVPTFSALQLNKEVTTPITLDNKLSENFLLKFSFKGVSLEEADTNFELTPVLIAIPMFVTLKVSVLGKEHKMMKIMESNSKYFQINRKESLILPKRISRKELLEVKSNCLKNDVLTLRCELHTVRFAFFIEDYKYVCPNLKVECTKQSSTFLNARCETSEHNVDTSGTILQKKDPLSFLGADLLTLYREQRMTDFELRSGDVTFPVHKIILSARSPVFKAMFSSDMKETVSNSQDVPDLDVHTLNRMLTFLYGDTVEPDLHLKSAAKLYYAADKYGIQSLKQQCSFLIKSSIQVSNVSDILTLADRHQDKELTSFIHEFVLNNYDEVMQSEEWEKFLETDSYLTGKTMLHLYKKKLGKKLL